MLWKDNIFTETAFSYERFLQSGLSLAIAPFEAVRMLGNRRGDDVLKQYTASDGDRSGEAAAQLPERLWNASLQIREERLSCDLP